jgi:hypothetical protein
MSFRRALARITQRVALEFRQCKPREPLANRHSYRFFPASRVNAAPSAAGWQPSAETQRSCAAGPNLPTEESSQHSAVTSQLERQRENPLMNQPPFTPHEL